MQRRATGLLLAAAALWGLARWARHSHPAWAWVGAFAEAALVGGLADWFAVTALFRHPLGLPIWHTAIVPMRKDDIARNVGEFVETHLLTPQALAQEVAEGDLAARLAEALQQPDTARQLARWCLQAAPGLLDSLDDDRLAAWLADAVQAELHRLDAPGLGLKALQRLASEQQHQRVLDAVADALQRYLEDPEHLPAVTDFIARALNLDHPLYRSVIKTAAPRATQAIAQQLGLLRDSPEHPWRPRLDEWVIQWLAELPAHPGWQARLEQWRSDGLASPSAQAWLARLWPRLKARLLAAIRSEDTPESPHPLADELATRVQGLGLRLQNDDGLRRTINAALADALAGLVQRHRGAAARFLETQLARWSPTEMSDKVERAIGRDLQFIRINGTLVGGLVGLLLHALKAL
jgi:uncharacterized membrane-anchored protein YjiN (DUF445 family)